MSGLSLIPRRLSLLALLLVSASLAGQEPPAQPARREMTGGPYCGIYALYAALKMQQFDVQFVDLIKPEYVSSWDGSTLADLIRAAEAHRAPVRVFDGMTATTLRNADDPIILHVRRPGRNVPYLHWILFLGAEGDQARIVDPPFGEQTLPFADLLALWDGVGMVVPRAGVSTVGFLWSSWLEQLLMVILAMLGVGLAYMLVNPALQRLRPRVTRLGRLMAGPLVLCATALLLGTVWHSLHDEGVLHQRPAFALVAGRYFDAPVPVLDLERLQPLISAPGVVLIDARLPEDYDSGHLPGAISLPITAGLVERKEILAGVAPRSQVVVYCQSESCRWGDAVANDLVFRGFDRVAVYRGGYREWAQRGKR